MNRTIQRLATTLAALSWTGVSAAQGYGGGSDHWHPMSGWGHMMYGGLMMIAFWAALIALVVLLVRWLGGTAGRGRGTSGARASALRILEERFARGEIEREEFEERKRHLTT